MTTEKRTVDSIIDAMKSMVENKEIIYPSWWLEAAQDLNVLLGGEHDELFNLQQKVAQKRLEFLEENPNVSSAKIKVEATDDYKEMCKRKAKITRIEEFIRLAKVQARMKDNELRNQ